MANRQRLCAVVDLDGTLLRGNSLRQLILFLVHTLLKSGDYLSVGHIVGLLAARRARLISHVAMKHPIHRIAVEKMTDEDIDRFVRDCLLLRINGKLMSRLKDLKSDGWKLVLATAAPDLYVASLCRTLGFDAYIATKFSENRKGYKETRGEFKKQQALALALETGTEIGLVATDHDDDLPLLTLPEIKRLLVAPTATLKLSLGLASLEFEEI